MGASINKCVCSLSVCLFAGIFVVMLSFVWLKQLCLWSMHIWSNFVGKIECVHCFWWMLNSQFICSIVFSSRKLCTTMCALFLSCIVHSLATLTPHRLSSLYMLLVFAACCGYVLCHIFSSSHCSLDFRSITSHIYNEPVVGTAAISYTHIEQLWTAFDFLLIFCICLSIFLLGILLFTHRKRKTSNACSLWLVARKDEYPKIVLISIKIRFNFSSETKKNIETIKSVSCFAYFQSRWKQNVLTEISAKWIEKCGRKVPSHRGNASVACLFVFRLLDSIIYFILGFHSFLVVFF